MKRVRWFEVGSLVGAAVIGGSIGLALAGGPKAIRYDFPLVAFQWDKAPERGGLARYLDEELGVACYTHYNLVKPERFLEGVREKLPKVAHENLACVKYR